MRFATNGYKIYDLQKDDEYLVNNVDADEITEIMNNLDIKAKERSKGMSTLQIKLNEQEIIIQELSNEIKLFGEFFRSKNHTLDEFNEWLTEKWRDNE